MKTVVLIELTCPAEEGIQNASVRKQERYADLTDLISNHNWTPQLFTVEVGARGFVAKSLMNCLKALGFPRNSAAKLAKQVSNISARCSYEIFNSHSSLNWDSKRPLLEHQTGKHNTESKHSRVTDPESKLSPTREKLPPPICNALEAKLEPENCLQANDEKMSRCDTLPSSSVTEQQLRRIHEQKAKVEAILERKKREKTDTVPSSSVTKEQRRRIHEQKAKTESILERKKREKTQLSV